MPFSGSRVRKRSTISPAAPSTRSAYSTSAWPSAVRLTRGPRRTNSGVCSTASSSRMRCDTLGWLSLKLARGGMEAAEANDALEGAQLAEGDVHDRHISINGSQKNQFFLITDCTVTVACASRRRACHDAQPRAGPATRLRTRRNARARRSQHRCRRIAALVVRRTPHAQPVPAWIDAARHAPSSRCSTCMLAIEVVLVFVSTMVRTFFNSSALMGVDEASPLFLDHARVHGRRRRLQPRPVHRHHDPRRSRARRAWNEAFKAFSEWIVIIVSLLIGGYSIPLIVANAEEKTHPARHQLHLDDAADHRRLRAVRRARGLFAAAPAVAHASSRPPWPLAAIALLLLAAPALSRSTQRCTWVLAAMFVVHDRDGRAGRLRARHHRHRLRQGHRLGRHDRRGDERAARRPAASSSSRCRSSSSPASSWTAPTSAGASSSSSRR